MKRLISTVMMVCGIWLASFAETQQTIMVNGTQVTGKSVVKMTFDNDENAIITYSDNSTDTAPVEQVKIMINYNATAINGTANMMFAYNGMVTDRLSIKGIAEGETVSVYDAAGRAKAHAKAGNDGVNIDMSKLASGIYMVKAGKTIVKVTKK